VAKRRQNFLFEWGTRPSKNEKKGKKIETKGEVLSKEAGSEIHDMWVPIHKATKKKNRTNGPEPKNGTGAKFR